MTTTHTPIVWFAGDDWEIRATLLDENGNPYDLTAAQIKWALIDKNASRVLDENDISVTLTDPVVGQCSIIIAAAKTSPLSGGNYSDVIRIVTGGITSTLSVGPVFVTADPWVAATSVTSAQPQRPALRLAK
jgi:hypothetical protein